MTSNEPRPYNLDDPEELDRLLRETEGYAKVSLHNKEGTDLQGREFAYLALRQARLAGFKLVKVTA